MPDKSETVAAIEAASKVAAEAIIESSKVAATAVLEAAKSANELVRSAAGGIAVLQNDISHIQTDIKEIKEKLENRYITKDEFDPVKKIVYGLVGVILVAVVGALIAIVVK
jgi:hypothetical protein